MVKDTRKYIASNHTTNYNNWPSGDEEEYFNWLADNNWSLLDYGLITNLYLDVDGPSVTKLANYIQPYLDWYSTYGLEWGLSDSHILWYNREYGVGAPYPDPITHATSPTDPLYTDYNNCIAYLENQPGFVGYWGEHVHENGLTWLRGHTNKRIMTAFYAHDWQVRGATSYTFDEYPGGPSVTWGPSYIDVDKRYIVNSDSVFFEFWFVDDVWGNGIPEAAQYIHDNYPDVSIGIDSAIQYPDVPISAGGGIWRRWRPEDRTLGDTNTFKSMTLEETMDRYEFHLNRFKEQMGFPFDYQIFESGGHWNPGGTVRGTVIENSYKAWSMFSYGFQDSVGLRNAITPALNVYPQRMTSNGITPWYAGAGVCGGASNNSFNNTGKEILCVKSMDGGTHTINVTGLDAYVKTYNVTVPSTRGLLLGPFPLDVFGTTPGIGYDTNDLYITILKDTPLADMPY